MPRSLPRLRPTTIARPRLLERLQRWPMLRLVQIAAPAGYGKTTLAELWLQTLMQHPRTERPDSAWIAIDRITDVNLFVRRMTEACLPFAPELEPLLTVDGSGEYTVAQRIHVLCTLLHRHPRRILLVIDDLHLLPNDVVGPLLQQLLDEAPRHVHFAMLARSRFQLQIDDLILDDAVVVFDEKDLALDHDEFIRFIHALGISDAQHSQLQQIEAQSEGWITGVKLMLHDRRSNAGAALRRPSDGETPPALAQFFESRVLSVLSEDERDFLHIGAQLPWISSDLMAAVTQRPREECDATLLALVRRNSLLTPLQASPEGKTAEFRYQLHALLQDFLRQRYTRSEHLKRSRALRMRAADWCIAHGHIEAALSLLHTPEEIRSRAEQIAGIVRAALLRHDLTSAQRWLGRIPTDVVRSHAALAVNAALAAYIAESATFAGDAEAAVRAAESLPADESGDELRTEALVLHALSTLIAHGSPALAAEITPLLERMPCRPDGLAAGYLHLLHGWSTPDATQPERRAQLIHRAAHIFEGIGFQFGAIEALISHGLVKRRSADAAGALASLTFAHATIERSNWSLSHLNIISRYTHGDVLYLLNRTEEARASLQQAIDVSDIGGLLPELAYLSRLTLTLCDCATSDDMRSVRVDDDADASAWVTILRTKPPHIVGLVAVMRILRDVRLGRLEGCRQTCEDLRRPLETLHDDDPDSVRMAMLSGAVLSGRSDDVTRTQLDRLYAHLLATGFRSMALHARVLQTIDAQTRGDMETATALLHTALSEVERTGFHRALLDHPALRPILAACGTPFAQQMLSRIADRRRPHRVFQLTPQELIVTRMLCRGLNPEQIADELTLGTTTILSHLRRIYRKMNVHSRSEAVRAARDAGIVDA